MRKGGISTIVATVLIVLITVAAVSIVWFGVAPMLETDVSTYDTRLSIVTAGGYTFFDPKNRTVTVQVEAEGEKSSDYVQIILTLEDGAELPSLHDAPEPNGVSRYYLYVGTYIDQGNLPVFVSVAPVFIVNGRNVLGQRGATVKLVKRNETEDFYKNVGESLDPLGNHVVGGDSGLDKYTGGGGGGGAGGIPSPPLISVEVYGCRNLNESGTEYKLMDNISDHSGTCFYVIADDVVLNLNGHFIDGIGSGIGVSSVAYDDVTVKNGEIYNFYSGIEFGSGSNNNIISDVVVGDNAKYGIRLSSSSNNTLSGIVSINNAEEAISLSSSSDNTLFDINSSNNGGDGVYLHNSNNNTLTNIISHNNYDGVFLIFNSKGNTLDNITATDNADDGIEFSSSPNNILRNSNMTNNRRNFYIYGSTNEYFDQNIDASNIVDSSYRIYYNYSISNYIFDLATAPDAGMVVCADCDNVTYKDLNLSGHRNAYGAYFFNTSNSFLTNIVSSDNKVTGIFIKKSSNNTLFNVTSSNNGLHGISVEEGKNNSFLNVVSNYNVFYGFNLRDTSRNILTNITSNDNLVYGLYFGNTDYNILLNVTLDSNDNDGLRIDGSDYNNIDDSRFCDNADKSISCKGSRPGSNNGGAGNTRASVWDSDCTGNLVLTGTTFC